MMKHLSALLAVFAFSFCCQAQSFMPPFIIPKGPSTITRTIKQDRKGHLWIAAFDGIFRYDGKDFTHVTSPVSQARFFSLLEDRKGHFWFTSIGSGVYYYDGTTFKNFTMRDGLVDDRVPFVYEDKGGNVWFGTIGGASRYDGTSFRNYKLSEALNGPPSPNDNDVNSIIEDKKGTFWFATRGKTFTYDGKTFTPLLHDGKPFINVRTLLKDSKDQVWLAGNDGLWRYDGTAFTQLSSQFTGYVYEDKKGNIWTSSVIGNNQGWALTCYDIKSLFRQQRIVFQTDAYGKMLFGILEDVAGNIWFGSQGVYRYDGKTVTGFVGKK